jgi:hypothetical protein
MIHWVLAQMDWISFWVSLLAVFLQCIYFWFSCIVSTINIATQFSEELCRLPPVVTSGFWEYKLISSEYFTDKTDLSKLPEVKQNKYVLFRPTIDLDWSHLKNTYHAVYGHVPSSCKKMVDSQVSRWGVTILDEQTFLFRHGVYDVDVAIRDVREISLYSCDF